MVDIPQIVLDAIKDSDILEEKLSDISLDLQANIQDQLYPGHGFITGDLHDSIQSDFTQDGLNGVVRAYSQIEYAYYVDQGHHSWTGYDFMKTGLQETVAMYK